MANQTANTSTLKMVNTTTTSSQNITQMFALDDEADDAIWILTSTFIIFTMQSGKLLRFFFKLKEFGLTGGAHPTRPP